MIPLLSFFALPAFAIALFASGWHFSRAWLNRDGKMLRLGFFSLLVSFSFLLAGLPGTVLESPTDIGISLHLIMFAAFPAAGVLLDLFLSLREKEFGFLRVFALSFGVLAWCVAIAASILDFSIAVPVTSGNFIIWTLPRFSWGEIIPAFVATAEVAAISLSGMQATLRLQDARLRLRSFLLLSFPFSAIFGLSLWFIVPQVFSDSAQIFQAKVYAMAISAAGILLTFSASMVRPGTPVPQETGSPRV